MLKLSKSDLKYQFYTNYIEQGEFFFEKKQVHLGSYDANEDEATIEGEIQESASRKYHTKIHLVKAGQPYVKINGTCSCPMSKNCKHCIALALEYIDKYDDLMEFPAHEAEHWLETIEALSTEDDESQYTHHLLYILAPHPHEKYALTVGIIKSYLLKNGSWGKPQYIPLDSLSDLGIKSLKVTDDDLDIITLCQALEKDFSSSEIQMDKVILNSPMGLRALNVILNTGRCFWQDLADGPLQFGARRVLDFYWKSLERGQQLKPRVKPAIDELYIVDKMLYVDFSQGLMGELHSAASIKQVRHLLKAPVIPHSHLEDLAIKLLEHMPEAYLPFPDDVELELIELRQLRPEVHLTLSTTPFRLHTDTPYRHHFLELAFDYRGIRLRQPLEKPVIFAKEGDTPYRLERDLEFEESVIDQLIMDTGLEWLKNTPQRFDFAFTEPSYLESVQKWHRFIEAALPRLEEQGWIVHISPQFNFEVRSVDQWYAEIKTKSKADWFELSLGIQIGKQAFNLLPLLVEFLQEVNHHSETIQEILSHPYVLLPYQGTWVKIPSDRLKSILDTLLELYTQQPLNSEGNLDFAYHEALHYTQNLDPELNWSIPQPLVELKEQLDQFKGIEEVELPKALDADLRPYQQTGLNWLQFLRRFKFNGILADDMGLGKTVQTLAHLQLEKEAGRLKKPVLVVAPTTVLFNWRNEIKRFTELKVLMLHGKDRKEDFENLKDYDMILTSYALIPRDAEFHLQQVYSYIILDEAQYIKNPNTKTAKAVFQLQSQHRLCLTGTPLENHLGELWSLFHFLMPGFLGPFQRFKYLFQQPLERDRDEDRGRVLKARIAPFMLRRLKLEVIEELPPKTEIVKKVALEGSQRDLYETIRLSMDSKVRDAVQNQGVGKSQILILDALLKLRQICCDPRLLKLKEAQSVKESAKLELLMDMLTEMVENDHKIIVFSQFTSMLDLVAKALDELKIGYALLTGKTRHREEVIASFQEGDLPIFLVSLKVGGVGLNLTAADSVIHYDPWWNPAVENQATDRAWRIGQDKKVFVYKLITENTVEEKILALQQRKAELAEGIYTDNANLEQGIRGDELLALLDPFN